MPLRYVHCRHVALNAQKHPCYEYILFWCCNLRNDEFRDRDSDNRDSDNQADAACGKYTCTCFIKIFFAVCCECVAVCGCIVGADAPSMHRLPCIAATLTLQLICSLLHAHSDCATLFDLVSCPGQGTSAWLSELQVLHFDSCLCKRI